MRTPPDTVLISKVFAPGLAALISRKADFAASVSVEIIWLESPLTLTLNCPPPGCAR